MQATRLGKHVNMIRRKIVDEHKSLAKKLKKLVKQWQQLLQNQTPNGLSSTSAVSTKTDASVQPSPPQSRVPTPKPTTEAVAASVKNDIKHETSSTKDENSRNSVTPPPLAPPQSLRQSTAMNFAKNRIKMMQMLSSVKKPNAPATQQPPLSQTQPQSSETINSSQTSETSLSQKPNTDEQHSEQKIIDTQGPAVSHTYHTATSISDNSHKFVSTLTTVPHTKQTCIVPPSRDDIPGSSQHALTNNFQDNSKGPIYHVPPNSSVVAVKGNELSEEIETPSVSLVVNIPRHLVILKINQSKSTSPKIDGVNRLDFESRTQDESPSTMNDHSSDLNLTVSIRTSLLKRVPPCPSSDGLKLKTECSTDPSNSSILHSNLLETHPVCERDVTEQLQTYNFDKSEATTRVVDPCLSHMRPSGKLKPPWALQGVHGCVGDDGAWYTWSDSIPGKDLSVTVLPYVYVDGFNANDFDL